MKIVRVVMIGLLLTLAGAARAAEIKIVGWNVENWGESDSGTIATQLRDEFDGIDLFGLSEVYKDAYYALFADYAGRDEAGPYKAIAGTTGNNVKLGILYREDRLELVDSFELTDLQFGSGGRAPLIARFKFKDGGDEFLFMVNHLHRGDEKKRLNQAIGLATWALAQSLPIVAVGDYNYDVDADTKVGNVAYDAFLANGAFRWLEPAHLVPTNWSDTRPQDGQNDFNSVLDFIFVTGALTGSSEILVRDGDFPDDAYRSDHRPVVAVVSTDPAQPITRVEELTPVRAASRSRELNVFAAAPRQIESGVNLSNQNLQVLSNAGQTQVITGTELEGLRQQIEQLRNEMRVLQSQRPNN